MLFLRNKINKALLPYFSWFCRFGFEMILWVSVVGFALFAVANTLVQQVRHDFAFFSLKGSDKSINS